MFVRNESFQQFIRFYPTVSAIIGLNALLYLTVLFPPVHSFVYNLGVGSNLHVAAGQYWRLLTPVFLHANFTHFLFNNFSLVIFAPALEIMLGRYRFLLLYIGAGVLGNVGTYYAGGLGYNFHLGASGAVYGILGFYLSMILFRQHLLDSSSSQVIKVFLVFGAIYSIIMPNINIYAHFFGFLAGLMFGHFLLQQPLAARGGHFKVVDIRSRKSTSFKKPIFKYLLLAAAGLAALYILQGFF